MRLTIQLIMMLMITSASFAQESILPLDGPGEHNERCAVAHHTDNPVPKLGHQTSSQSTPRNLTCQASTNQEWAALSPQSLLTTIKQTGNLECYRALFSYHATYSPQIFSDEKIRLIADEAQRLAITYDGTDSNGIYGLAVYMHAAIFLDFSHNTITVTPEAYLLFHKMIENLEQNPDIFKNTTHSLRVLDEVFILVTDPNSKSIPASLEMLKKALTDMVVTKSWKDITGSANVRRYVIAYNRIFDAFTRSYNDDFANALKAESEIFTLLQQVATDQEIHTTGGNLRFFWINAARSLSQMASNEITINEIEPTLVAMINFFPNLSPQWIEAMIALNTYGNCQPYNLCQSRDEIIAQLDEKLFPKTVSYDDGKMIFRTPLSDEKIQNLYHAAKQVQSQFFELLQTDEPVAGDTNETVTMVIFGSRQEYDDFGRLLFNIATNNGGIYIEARGTFYTWDRTVGVESSLSLESLFRHEYVHYLQGRYLVPGPWGQAPWYTNNRMVWYDEGMAEFFSGSSDTTGVRLLESNAKIISRANSNEWPTLSTVFNSSYTSGNQFHYHYGNPTWQNWYLNEPTRLKQFFDLTRSNNVSGYDALVNQLRTEGQSSYQQFLTNVDNGTVQGWEPETDWKDDNFINISSTEDIERQARASLSNLVSQSEYGIEVSDQYRRFKITGKISADGAVAMERKVEEALTNLRNGSLSNNFDYTVGYFKNLNGNTADVVITGPLRDEDYSDSPVADFTAQNRIGVIGSTIKFENQSDGAFTGLRWTLQNGSPSTVTGELNPEITYNTEGKHDVRLYARGRYSSEDHSILKTDYVTIHPENVNDSYCIASNLPEQGITWITGVKLAEINNETQWTQDYNDFTDIVAVLRNNSSEELEIFTHNNSITTNAVGAWIDWNIDGDFDDPGEKVFHKLGQRPFKTTITVPPTATLGTTRMRVRLSFGFEENIVPCGDQSNRDGEIEDYTIVVTDAPEPNNVNPLLEIMKPRPNTVFMEGDNISVEVSATDEGTITNTELFVDGELYFTDTVEPYQWNGYRRLSSLAPGDHTLTVVAHDDRGGTTTESVNISIEEVPPVYCEASASETSSTFIDHVTFNTIDNDTDFKPYEDFTSISTTIPKNTSTRLVIRTNNDSFMYHALGVWIDWNYDGVFSNSEFVYEQRGSGPFEGDVTPPEDVRTEVPLRMRVLLGWGSNFPFRQCELNHGWGGVQDYTVMVIDGNSASSANQVNFNQNQSVIETSDIAIYPNPFKNGFTINTEKLNDEGFNVEVFNILGQSVLQKSYNKNPKRIYIDKELMNNGYYFVKVKNVVLKLIKI